MTLGLERRSDILEKFFQLLRLYSQNDDITRFDGRSIVISDHEPLASEIVELLGLPAGHPNIPGRDETGSHPPLGKRSAQIPSSKYRDLHHRVSSGICRPS
jgi:hypothetical protein